jgi:ubiquinone/menaquinone biosynthesis C-methylase UbiE
MSEVHKLVDLAGLHVLDCGAGTGRSTTGAACRARQVTAIDVFPSALAYGRKMVAKAGCRNVTYSVALSSRLPFPDNIFDAAICSWSILEPAEAFRVLKPGGYILELGPAPGALCGELTGILRETYPHLITEVAPAEQYQPGYPDTDSNLDETTWNGVPVIPPVMFHDFTYISDYGDPQETAAIVGRLYGPAVRKYLEDRKQSTLGWRLRVAVYRVRKQ